MGVAQMLHCCAGICGGQSVRSTRGLTGGKAFAREITPTPEAEARAAVAADDFLEPGDWDGRVKGTPVQDEAFICMGSKAPVCPKPAPKATSGPITLDTLQGLWVGSSGSQISVMGTAVMLNGMPLNNHAVELREDGTVCSIGSLWQLDRWGENGTIEFRASSTRENMECARLEVWTRKEAATGWDEKMALMGYAGSAATPMERGIEGCCPGTLGAELPVGQQTKRDREDVAMLTALVQRWREPGLVKVRPRSVVPDFTNRAQTGLGVELVHFIATSMKEKGFQRREGNKGHDIPVVVREPAGTRTYDEALQVWRERVTAEEGFPPIRVGKDELFSSLGNGHFFQALNLIDCQCTAINHPGFVYSIGNDALLAEAVRDGVPSIVLKNETPKPARAKIAELLNSKRDFFWSLAEDGSVDTSQMNSKEDDKCSQFEWLSKGMDAHQVDCLVRTHLGIRDSRRIQG
eukprot:TRINITY_DN71168_c0_g1_i1.p1 TRINITY_DN71168_c0_g1~~TRINITY_DN71168_c0_g1_i1.p1  ORF type:complete len:463 (+),score=83.93 TRINITY_DN71168_c0_g1_i1:52-1440(+)